MAKTPTQAETPATLPEDVTPAVETTQDETIPASETAARKGADNPDLDAAKAAADAEAEPIDPKRIEDLNHLTLTIHMLNTTGHRLGLVDELQNLWGAEIVESDDPYAVTVTMQGITIDPADSIETALTNWANAARRAIAAAA